jgi:hypothetical protein
MKLRGYIALLVMLAPALALAKPRAASTHMRPQLFRDKTPKARVRQSSPRGKAASQLPKSEPSEQ